MCTLAILPGTETAFIGFVGKQKTFIFVCTFVHQRKLAYFSLNHFPSLHHLQNWFKASEVYRIICHKLETSMAKYCCEVRSDAVKLHDG